jgi:hypothetical protein
MTEPMNDMTLIDRGADTRERRDVPGTDGLWALRSYWDASPQERARMCNGAGPRWLDRYLPWWLRWVRIFADRLWALDCRRAFDIHDWDYARLPHTPAGKIEADDRLRDNLDSIIRSARGPQWLTELRRREARRYVRLVREFGYKAFFDRD